MKILKNFFTFIVSIWVTGIFLIASVSVYSKDTPREQKVDHLTDVPSIQYYKTSIVTDEAGKKKLQKESLSDSHNASLEKWQAGYIEFGKLASAFFLSNSSWSLSFDSVSLSGQILQIDPRYSSIISLYDPFSVYTINSKNNDFSLVQVTNGSFYVGMENDGTYSVYSIDAVVRLDFLSQGKKMTDMVLFPWMYIRFDPLMNKTLDGANLFRILQTLEPNGTQDVSVETTGIEFVNPRMNTSNQKDAFIMYRLPGKTILFQMLHLLFYERVSMVDINRDFGSNGSSYNDIDEINPWLVNPWKKWHILLLWLDSILSQWITDRVSLDTFRGQIANIEEKVSGLSQGNTVQLRLEKFLTDGRFALFGWTRVNPQFSELYWAVSEIVGKAPVTPHAKLLQRLSDIYSKNLVTQKKDLAFPQIDTYSPTALELEKTLESTDIQQRDYFDIALYAFNVLKKTEDNGLFVDEAIYAHPTYSLIQTILVSTDRYTRSITDPDKKKVTYEWIVLHFYHSIISTLAKSVFHTFTQNEDGFIYIKPAFRPTTTEPIIHMDEGLIRDIQNIDGIISLIIERLDAQYGENSTHSAYLDIKKYAALFHGFSNMIDIEGYNDYIKMPYRLDATSATILPQYDPVTKKIIVGNPVADIVTSTGTKITDPAIESIISILGDVPREKIIKDGDSYLVQWHTINVPNIKTGTTREVTISVNFNSDISIFSNLSFDYNWQNISFVTSSNTADDLRAILIKVSLYIDRYDDILSGNPSLTWAIRFLDTTQKIAIWNYLFPLVP